MKFKEPSHMEASKEKPPQVTVLKEVPSTFKELARLVVRGFYALEDSLIIDMLVRNPCVKEDDIAELLRFEKKTLRARLTVLRADKFVQVRLKMETGPDGKAQKVNYYFINYKLFINMVKYKLDLMRKRMATEERDATSRASFKCLQCAKTYTDLEADQLFDFNTQEFRCTYCDSVVEEDISAMPKKDSRLMVARFNEQIEPLYELLRTMDNVQLSPELLEPEPVDIEYLRNSVLKKNSQSRDSQQWSGEATRSQGFSAEETRVSILVGDNNISKQEHETRDRPIWLSKSTVENDDSPDAILKDAANKATLPDDNNQQNKDSSLSSNSGNINSVNLNIQLNNNRNKKDTEDIFAVLLQNEKETQKNGETNQFENDNRKMSLNAAQMPTVMVCGRPLKLDSLTDHVIQQMTPQERDYYIAVYQNYFNQLFH